MQGCASLHECSVDHIMHMPREILTQHPLQVGGILRCHAVYPPQLVLAESEDQEIASPSEVLHVLPLVAALIPGRSGVTLWGLLFPGLSSLLGLLHRFWLIGAWYGTHKFLSDPGG